MHPNYRRPPSTPQALPPHCACTAPGASTPRMRAGGAGFSSPAHGRGGAGRMVAHARCASGPGGACPVRVAVGAGGGGGAGAVVAPLPVPHPPAPSRLSAAASLGSVALGPRRRVQLLAAPLPGGSGKPLPPHCHGDRRVPPPGAPHPLPAGPSAAPGGRGAGAPRSGVAGAGRGPPCPGGGGGGALSSPSAGGLGPLLFAPGDAAGLLRQCGGCGRTKGRGATAPGGRGAPGRRGGAPVPGASCPFRPTAGAGGSERRSPWEEHPSTNRCFGTAFQPGTLSFLPFFCTPV